MKSSNYSKKAVKSGKKLDFLIQELHREANTLGAKSSVLELTRISVEMKVLIEQMREQVQNIEYSIKSIGNFKNDDGLTILCNIGYGLPWSTLCHRSAQWCWKIKLSQSLTRA